VIDVRSPDEVNSGHISCAYNFDWRAYGNLGCDDSVFVDYVKSLGAAEEDTITLFCRSGSRSEAATQALVSAGFKHVQNGLGYGIPAGNSEWLESLCHADCVNNKACVATAPADKCIHQYSSCNAASRTEAEGEASLSHFTHSTGDSSRSSAAIMVPFMNFVGSFIWFLTTF
jgi:rhodanese-related sulfurtransferase